MVKELDRKGFRVAHIGKNYTRSFIPNWSKPLAVSTPDAGSGQPKDGKFDIPLFVDNPMYEYLVDNVDISGMLALLSTSTAVVSSFSCTSLLAAQFNKPLLMVVKKYGFNSFWGGKEFIREPERFKWVVIDDDDFLPEHKALIRRRTLV